MPSSPFQSSLVSKLEKIYRSADFYVNTLAKWAASISHVGLLVAFSPPFNYAFPYSLIVGNTTHPHPLVWLGFLFYFL
jgi:hypothetical protein